MTQQEFKIQSLRLITVFGNDIFNDSRMAVIYESIRDMEINWFRKIVDSMILNYDHRINFVELVKNERQRLKSLEFTNDVIESYEILNSQITDNGLSNALKKLGVKSLTEAITKK